VNGIADYQFIRLLGEGNHGRCWLAHPPQRLGLRFEHVAVKTLTQRAGDDNHRRLRDEMRRYATVESPYLAPLYDAGRHNDQLFYARAYQPGGSLDEAAADLSPREIVHVVACAARGAHALHEAGISHRDIKPQNVFVTDDGGMLGDLGLAQLLNRGQTVTGIGPVGAVEYLAPEAIRSSSGSRAADVWALGATLHHALTGASLYPGLVPGDLLASLRHVLSSRPLIDPDLDPHAQNIVEACLAQDPADRPLTAEELAAELDALATPDVPA
jgi:serine/threonine protein kinase